jgi:hypothetical protein
VTRHEPSSAPVRPSADEIVLLVPRHVREAYRRTEIVIELPRGRWLSADKAMKSLSPPVFVITAANPKGKRLAEALNQERNDQLRLELFDTGADVLAATGSSADGRHVEESWAVRGIGPRKARSLGRSFDQWTCHCHRAWRAGRG